MGTNGWWWWWWYRVYVRQKIYKRGTVGKRMNTNDGSWVEGNKITT